MGQAPCPAPLIGQRRAHQRQIAAVHLYRALLEVGFKDFRRLFTQNVEIAQHPSNGPIAVSGIAFGLVDLLIHAQLTPCTRREIGQNALYPGPAVDIENLSASGDCSIIDHRIERCPGSEHQANSSEGLA